MRSFACPIALLIPFASPYESEGVAGVAGGSNSTAKAVIESCAENAVKNAPSGGLAVGFDVAVGVAVSVSVWLGVGVPSHSGALLSFAKDIGERMCW
jgi:hypothetical protein